MVDHTGADSRHLWEHDGPVRDEVDDTDMTAAEFRAARNRGTPMQVVTSREEFDVRSRQGGAKFEVYADRSGKFRFRLRASNGQVVATSEAYETKAAAMKGAESVQLAAASAMIVDVAS
jgi:uncharacterized protein YegP (UPF0339 family)